MAAMELEVPANLYGMAIAEPPQLNKKHDGALICVLELTRVYTMLFINYVVSLLFVLQVKQMNDVTSHHCSGGLVVLEFICVFIFEVQMLAHTQESFSMMFLLLSAKEAKEPSNTIPGSYSQARDTSPSHGAVLAQEGAAGSWLRRLRRRLRGGEASAWTLDGISRRFKAWSLLVVAVPKFLLGLAVAYTGGVYIIKSQNEETMVMSTLAVVFIAEIDEILYLAFTSSVMRYHLENMAAVEVQLSNAKRLGLWFASGMLAPLLMAAATVFIMWHTRQMECNGEVWSMQDVRNEMMDTIHSVISL